MFRRSSPVEGVTTRRPWWRRLARWFVIQMGLSLFFIALGVLYTLIASRRVKQRYGSPKPDGGGHE